MNKTEWNEGMNHLDSDLVERYVEKKDRLLRRGRAAKKTWLRVGIVAACFLILVSAALTVPMPQKDPYMDPYFPSGEAWAPTPEVKETVLSATEIASVFDEVYDSIGTNQYQTVYAASPEQLRLTPLPNAEYLPIYSINRPMLSEARLDRFIQKYLASANAFFGMSARSYEIEKMEQSWEPTYYTADVEDEKKHLRFTERNNLLYFRYDCVNEYVLKINGEMVTLLVTDTDEQIKEKLKDTVTTVCAAFGKDYSNIKVVRHYARNGKLSSFGVYLYSAQESGFAQHFSKAPLSAEYIRLTFSAVSISGHYRDKAHLNGFTLSESISKWTDYYRMDAKSKMLTLEEAEQLLEKGYVFGGHSCPLCMAQQPEVDFTDYTCVGFEYVADSKGKILVPFYTFYKYIGENYNGETTFAKTYVPAVQVEGLEEYFQMQTAQHPSGK